MPYGESGKNYLRQIHENGWIFVMAYAIISVDKISEHPAVYTDFRITGQWEAVSVFCCIQLGVAL